MIPSPLRYAILSAWLVAAALAAPKLDLTRVTPVPADQPIPTQDFFRPLALAQPVINHGGTHIAAVISGEEDKHLLLVYDIARDRSESTGSNEEKDIYNVAWLSDDRVLFHISSRKMYGLGILAADVGHLGEAYPIQQYNGSGLVSIPLKNPLFPLVWNRHDMENRHDLGVVELNANIKTGKFVDLVAADARAGDYFRARDQNAKTTVKTYPVPSGAALTAGYLADKEGGLAYCITALAGDLTLLRLQDDEWLRCPVDLERIRVVGSANEPGQLYVAGPAVDGKPDPLRIMEAASGKLGEVILQDTEYDYNGWLYRNPATGDVLGAIFNKNIPRVYWFNEEYRNLQKALDGMFPNKIVRIYGSDDRHRMFLVGSASDRQPTIYHWVNLETRKVGIFRSTAPWIDPQRMQPMQIMTFKTRDGHKLDAYLTLPAGATKETPAPLVVLCHGGPWARDHWGYNGEVQFLAHHGYAVLQPNYRGSTGSVGRFPDEDEFDFVKMHQDVTDAVGTALKTGLLDRDRVGIMGGSFGGYLAVSGVAHEPGLYRCAVTNAGVFDWALQVQSEKYDQYDRPFYGRLIKKLGDPKKEPEKYEAMSPIKFVQDIRVPVFVAGGLDDETVEIDQSKKLLAALDRFKIPYEKLLVSGEGHGMAYLKHKVELYDSILAFLDKNLMPKR